MSSSDLEAAWPAVQAAAVWELVASECARPDGRGLRDLRPLRLEARPFPMGFGCSHTSGAVVH